MFGAITVSKIDLARGDEAEAVYRDKLIPLARQYGVLRLTLFVDRTTGKSVSVALWPDEESARAYESSGGFREGIALFGDMFVEQPKREVFDVAVDSNT